MKHTTIVDWLRAVGPHVWTLCEINVARMQAGLRLVILENMICSVEVQLALSLLEHVDAIQPKTRKHK